MGRGRRPTTGFWRWARNGTLTMLVGKARVIAEAIDELDREVSVGSSIVRAHQHAAGARRSALEPHTGGRRSGRRVDRVR